MSSTAPSGKLTLATIVAAALTVATGVTQPLLITVAKDAGLADPTAQLYMLFYYLGPASVSLSLRRARGRRPEVISADGNDEDEVREDEWPSCSALLKAASIAAIDIFAQSMNYTGVNFAGPTIFAIIYSSVTVWTAVYSRIFLKRYLVAAQWVGIATVFGGLTLTAFHSVELGSKVLIGACQILVGSSVHALGYVISEMIMTRGNAADRITVRANCAVQGLVACLALLLWQLLYTRPRFDELIGQPMAEAGTSWSGAATIFGLIALSNFFHSLSFFYTLRHFPGGAVSAGVLKGLQAVLVFVFTSVVFCGRTGGAEMCFNFAKLVSLIVVVGGVLMYGKATEMHTKQCAADGIGSGSGYKTIPDASLEVSPIP